MGFFRRIRNLTVYLSVFAMLSMQAASVQAAMVSNSDILQQAQQNISVKQLVSMLDQNDIQEKLVSLGVDPSAAKDRIARMTGSELAELRYSLEELPAGAGAIEVILTIFIVLVITDMLGATNVFPFVKNINR